MEQTVSVFMRADCLRFVVVLLCIFATAWCTLQGTLFTRELIDVHIKGIMEGTSTFAHLGARLARLAAILAVGVGCSYLQQRIMVVVTQGSMLKIRNELFTHMEELPIKYFDTHSHGDIMSVYTNDVDAMRMLIGGSLTQLGFPARLQSIGMYAFQYCYELTDVVMGSGIASIGRNALGSCRYSGCDAYGRDVHVQAL